MRIAITGATGFIGRRICSLLQSPQYRVRALARDATAIEALARLGGVLEQQGDTPGAREAYQRYIEQGGERK